MQEKPLRTNKTSIHKGKNKNGKCIYKALHTHSRPAVKTSHLPMWSSCYAHTPHQEHTTPKKKSVSAATFSRVRMWPFTTEWSSDRFKRCPWTWQNFHFTPLHSIWSSGWSTTDALTASKFSGISFIPEIFHTSVSGWSYRSVSASVWKWSWALIISASFLSGRKELICFKKITANNLRIVHTV